MTYDERFERFWERAWRKDAKFAAHEVWLKMSNEDRTAAEDALEAHRVHQSQTELKYRPHVRKWLRNRMWEDELGDPLPQQEAPEWMNPGGWERDSYPRGV